MKFWPHAVSGGKKQFISLCFEEVVTSAKCTLDLVGFLCKGVETTAENWQLNSV